MPLASNYNAIFTIEREVKSGDEDGTPIFTTASHQVAGWFDGLETRQLNEPFRGDVDPISYMDRRALFLCDANANIRQDDEGTITIGGITQGRWQVSDIVPAPIPSGVGHLEVQLQGPKEGR